MTRMAVYQQIVKHPLLAGLPPGWLRALAVHGELVDCAAGVRLFSDGDPADAFWLVRSGAVTLDLPAARLRRTRVGRIGRDEVLGWSWLVPPYRFTLGAVVAEPMRAVEIRAAGARRLMESDPVVKAEFLTRYVRVLGERLEAVRRCRAPAVAGGEDLTKVPYATAHRP